MTPDKVEAALSVLRRYGELCIGEGWTLEKGRVNEALSVLTEALAERDALRDLLATVERDRDSARAAIELAGLARRKPHDR